MSKQSFEPKVPIASIVCPPQVREHFDDDEQAGLNMTVRERGIQVPLLLRRSDGKLYLWDGARRLRAAQAAEHTTVPAIIEESDVADVDVTLWQVILNGQHADLLPLEKARAIDAVMKRTGASATQMAAKLGMNNSMVTRLLGLLKLPDPIQNQVASGQIPISTAYEISRLPDEAEQLKCAAQAAAGQLTRDGASGAQRAKKRRNAAPMAGAKTTRMAAKLGEGKSLTVIGNDLTIESFIEMLENVLARARQARTKGFSLDTFRKILADTAGV